MTAGLYIMTFGVALSTKAELGTSPISCIPYVLSLALPLTIGGWTFLMNLLFVIIQYLLLRSDFSVYKWLEILVIFVFSLFTDINMFFVSFIPISGYLMQWIFCILSFFAIALGLAMVLKANVLMMAVDSLVLVISGIFRIEFGKVKIVTDSSMVILAVILSFALMGNLFGVREGTIAAALSIGFLVRHIRKLPGFKDNPAEKKSI
ncbi:DUF6198 family protein [Methanomicrobium antiquum]|uniref:DUF6198 family protein n=1 Tax=Methanomicrobium antiquum TaxID=487686 RepID=A0AAF0FWD2_9EURY|nr:DUF6198 family protein [Methanomicrobium antiquum]MDD3976578.1 DUF6198 family protein [Methanomicrobium sp.]WFN37523.1 DUF6198 family protein [Methanomicrobium antiquum]